MAEDATKGFVLDKSRLASDKSYRKMMMAKIKEESRISGEKARMKMLADPSLCKAMDEQEVLRLMSEANQRRKQATLKRKESQAADHKDEVHQRQQASDQEGEAIMAAGFREDWEYCWSGSFGCFEDTSEYIIKLSPFLINLGSSLAR
jgi:hypothetical protein